MTTAVLLGAGLVVYGTAINLAPLPDRLYVTLNIGAGVVALVIASGVPGVGLHEIGLDVPSVRAGALSAALVLSAVAGVVATLRWGRRSERVATLLTDERVAGLDTSVVVERAVVRIPVGTAAFEEVAFRGALLAALMEVTSVPVAVAGSSAAFGLWHIAPTWQYLRMNRVNEGVGPIALAVVGTAAGGAVLCVLRLVTGGLLVPWVAHGAVNVAALVATHLHQRDQRE